MEPILFVHNVDSADVMPHDVTCGANPNDVMHGSHDTWALVRWMYLCNFYTLKFTCWTGMQECQPTTTKINCLTFLGTNYQKCKQEPDKKDSFCVTQVEQGHLQ